MNFTSLFVDGPLLAASHNKQLLFCGPTREAKHANHHISIENNPMTNC
jgi:hypothetical protein